MDSEASSTSEALPRWALWKRVAVIAGEVVLILIVIGLIVATLLPVFHGASPNAIWEDARPGRRR